MPAFPVRPEPETVRLARLERSLTRWKRAVVCALAAGAVPWVVGASTSSRDSGDVNVRSLRLISEDGTEHAALRLENGKPVLMLKDGQRHVTLTLSDGNAGLACGGPSGVTFAGVSDSGAYFNARGPDLRTGVYAGVAAEGEAAFRAYGTDQRVSAALESTPAGVPRLMLSDPRSGQTTLPVPGGT